MGRDRRILVVDDNPLFAEGVSAVLEREGYDVMSCYSGRECLQNALEFKPHAIISDHVMGDMTGLEVLKTLKQDETAGSIPFIVITGFKTRSLEREFEKAGAHVIISKSEAASRLLGVIDDLLGGQT